ncbi:unnamed protein product [Psylliodes chrysocephalus]|uniref:F-box domain-containing protein n=1 Tax=Psylliodes chrysocephalus TaxID=3402493 RepID=A0A9P0GGP7_9CUCU|nr:unnamed protein product [Psylliodes chrysocephala]
MFQILSVIAASYFNLTTLPVEMWSTILRYLDPLSLLNVAKSTPYLLDVCQGDPILRKQLQRGLKEEKNLAIDLIANPRKILIAKRRLLAKKAFHNVFEKKKSFTNILKRKASRDLEDNSRQTKKVKLCRI